MMHTHNKASYIIVLRKKRDFIITSHIPPRLAVCTGNINRFLNHTNCQNHCNTSLPLHFTIDSGLYLENLTLVTKNIYKTRDFKTKNISIRHGSRDGGRTPPSWRKKVKRKPHTCGERTASSLCPLPKSWIRP